LGHADFYRLFAGKQVDPVAGGEGDAGIGVAEGTVVHDRDRDPLVRPGDVAECPSGGGRARGDGDFQDLVAAQRGGRLAEIILRAVGLRLRGAGPGGMHVAGHGLQHVLAGDPALQVLPVSSQHRQAVAAVEFQLAQGLGQGLPGEEHLRIALLGDRAGQRRLGGT